MRSEAEIQDEVERLILLSQVVDDSVYEKSLSFTIKAFEWALSGASAGDGAAPSNVVADEYKGRSPMEKAIGPAEAPAASPAELSQPSGIIMQVNGDQFVVPPFPFREPFEEETPFEYFKWFHEAMQEFVTNVFGQVKAKNE